MPTATRQSPVPISSWSSSGRDSPATSLQIRLAYMSARLARTQFAFRVEDDGLETTFKLGHESALRDGMPRG
jgi:hypothetical protein